MNLNYAYDPHMWPSLITLVLMIFLGFYSWRRRNMPGARVFAVASLFGALWALGALLETQAIDFASKVIWTKFQAAWQLPTATALLCFVLDYGGFGRRLNRWSIVLLFSIPILTGLLIATNDYHHLIWTGFSTTGSSISQSFGNLNWILVGYAGLLALVTIAILVHLAIGSPRRRGAVTLMLIGQVTGLGIYLLGDIFSVLLSPGERVLFVLGPLSIAYGYAFSRLHFLDPVPTAREAAIAQMLDGMLVLDLEGRVTDVNASTVKILGKTPNRLLGQHIAEILPGIGGQNGQPKELVPGEREITLDSTGESREYGVNLTALTDGKGGVLGSLLLLHDITEQKLAQAKVLEQQRTMATLEERERLARELHDGVGQVLGYTAMQAQTAAEWLRNENEEKAESLMVQLAEVAKDAHADVRESILGLRAGSTSEWSFIPALRQYLRNYQTNYGIQTELSMTEGMRPDFLKTTIAIQVLRVIQEALTNVRKHGGAQNVKITFEQNDSRMLIKVIDDGVGFDPTKLEKETVRHFGLTFMRERMGEVGGTMTVDSSPGMGTVVNLNVPIGVDHQ